MKIFKNNQDGGFVKTILLIVIVLIILGYFGFNLHDIVQSPTVQANLHYVWGLVLWLWDHILRNPALAIWHFLQIIFNWLLSLFTLSGQNTSIIQ